VKKERTQKNNGTEKTSPSGLETTDPQNTSSVVLPLKICAGNNINADKSIKNNSGHGMAEKPEASLKVKTKSKRNAPIFGLNYHLSPDATEILKRLAEQPQSEIADHGHFSKQKVNYWTRKYLKQGLIREKSIGKPKFYDLTAVGQTILTRSEGSFVQPCIMEDYPVKFQLVKDRSCLPWEKLGDPRNWEKLGVHIGNVRVEKTSQSIIIHTGQLSGFNPHYLLVEAGQIIALVRAILQDKGVELGSFGLPQHDPIYKFYNQAAEVLNHLFGTVNTKDGSLDHSPPDDISHMEFRTAETAANFLAMPNRVAKMEQRQVKQDERDIKSDERLSRIELLAEKFVNAIEKLTGTEDSAPKVLKPHDSREVGVV
jgi:hypothetical protein